MAYLQQFVVFYFMPGMVIPKWARWAFQAIRAPLWLITEEYAVNSKNWERFTQRARQVLSLAQEEAERLNHSYIGSEHVLIGLLQEDGGVAGRVLRELGLEAIRVQAMVERMSGGPGTRTPFTKIELSPSTKRILELAVDEARRMGQHYISTEHLLLGLARQNEGLAIDVLEVWHYCGSDSSADEANAERKSRRGCPGKEHSSIAQES